MANDGTLRGGARIGAGRKPKAIAEKLENGNPGKRELKVLEFNPPISMLKGEDMPKPKDYLSAQQKDGKPFLAAEIYNETYQWLQERGCIEYVSPLLLERFAISFARMRQAEEAISEFGLLAKHPTTNQPIQSPFCSLAQNYMNQTNRIWLEIWQIVREQCTTAYTGDGKGQPDFMEQLLTRRF